MGRRAIWLMVAGCALITAATFILAGCGSSSSSGKPRVDSLTPNNGEAGSQVVITGEGFGSTQGTGTVHFGNTLAGETAWTDTSITVKVPSSLTPAACQVTVTTTEGASNEAEFTVTQKVATGVKITSLAPASGVAGIQVIAAGVNFGAAEGKVLFGPGTAEVVSWSDTSVTFKVPANSTPNAYGVKVETTAGARSNEAIYTLHTAPESDLSAQKQAILDYMSAEYGPDSIKGNENWKLSLAKKSTIDPNWEVVNVVIPDREGGQGLPSLLVWNNMLGGWECLTQSTDYSNIEFKGEPVPSDLWVK